MTDPAVGALNPTAHQAAVPEIRKFTVSIMLQILVRTGYYRGFRIPVQEQMPVPAETVHPVGPAAWMTTFP